VSTRISTLTDGCIAVARLLSPRVPDAFLLAGLTLCGIGVYALNPRAIWLYAGACCVWFAFALAANQKGGV
jgi:hypothetical protein